MTEPVITINGRLLTEAQAMAVRVAITTFHAEMSVPGVLGQDEHGQRISEAYRDRLTEVLMINRSSGRGKPIDDDGATKEAPPSIMNKQRVDRILQLAGIVPEQASEVQLSFAKGYVRAGIAPDEAAVRLKRALGVK